MRFLINLGTEEVPVKWNSNSDEVLAVVAVYSIFSLLKMSSRMSQATIC